MKKTRIVRDEADTMDLLETYSTENYKLLQVETNKIYGSSVVDVIDMYIDGKPFSKYTYQQTDEKDAVAAQEIQQPQDDLN